MSLSQAILTARDRIRLRLRIGRAHRDELVERVAGAEARSTYACDNEQLWTFVLVCA
jgi:hypothetical protein